MAVMRVFGGFCLVGIVLRVFGAFGGWGGKELKFGYLSVGRDNG
jgi:hypothetical protein